MDMDPVQNESFVFMRSYFDAANNLEEADRHLYYEAIIKYGLTGQASDMPPVVRSLFVLSKPTIDASLRRYYANVKNGQKGGRPKGNPTETQEEPNHNPTETQEKPNGNLNKDKAYNMDSNIDMDSHIGKDKPDQKKLDKVQYPSDFISWWSVYSPGRSDGKQAAFKAFKARLNDGYSADDLTEAARKYLSKCRRERTEKKYILMASTFLGPTLRFEDYMPKCHDSTSTDQIGGVVNPFAKYLQEGGR